MALIDNLISYYKLDEASGAVLDAHGSNDGTNYGATPNVAGKINTAYGFATNDYIDLGDFDLTTASDFSFSFWVKPTFITEYSRFFSNRLGSSGYFCRVTNADDGKVSFGGVGGTIIETTDTLTEGSWNHVVITGESGTIKIYINGGTPATGTTTISSTAQNLYLGRAGEDAKYLTGDLDEFAIFNTNIGQAGATALWNSGSGLAYPFTYKQERSAGRLKIGKGIWGKRKSTLFSKDTAEGEVKIKTATGTEPIIITPNTSYNSSTTVITKTTTTYTSMISKSHKSNTGKVMIIAQTPAVVKIANGDISMRLTESGNLIEGSENINIWSSGDGCINICLMAFKEIEIGKAKTYALQWKQGYAELDFDAGGDWGAYNIVIQDII